MSLSAHPSIHVCMYVCISDNQPFTRLNLRWQWRVWKRKAELMNGKENRISESSTLSLFFFKWKEDKKKVISTHHVACVKLSSWGEAELRLQASTTWLQRPPPACDWQPGPVLSLAEHTHEHWMHYLSWSLVPPGNSWSCFQSDINKGN